MKIRFQLTLPILASACSVLFACGGVLGYALLGWPGIVVASLVAAAAGWILMSIAFSPIRHLPKLQTSARTHGRAASISPIAEIAALQQRWAEAEKLLGEIGDSEKEFIANAAHQLRTPLAALRLAGENALRDPSSAKTETIGEMLEEAGRCSRLVDRLLTLARAESGSFPVHPEAGSVEEFLNPLLEWFQPLAQIRNISIHREPAEPQRIFADPTLLRLALENLLDNAIKYSPEGGTVIVRVEPGDAGGVAIEIVDDGPGLSPDEQRRIFQRFRRGGSGGVPGSGLGLPIAQWAARLIGARIEQENRIGGGSIFRLLCPQTEFEDFSEISDPDVAGWRGCEARWVAEAGITQVLARLQSRRSGLTEEEAQARRQMDGPNQVGGQHSLPAFARLGRVIASPFNGVLAISLGISLAIGETGSAGVMAAMILLSAGLRYWQEESARRAAWKLSRRASLLAEVARPGLATPVQVPIEDLVCGDVVYLRAGDMVPADIRILSSSALEVLDLNTTGEPSDLQAVRQDTEPKLCWMGSHILAGEATGVIFATGSNTKSAQSTTRSQQKESASQFDIGVVRVSRLLLSLMGGLLPVVFLLTGILQGNWTEALVFALATAVGLTPELLPMLVNVNLARAARQMASQGVLFKSLPSVQELGAMDVLCLGPAVETSHPALRESLESIGVSCLFLTRTPLSQMQDPKETWLSADALELLPDAEASALLNEAAGVAGLTPFDQARVVRLLRAAGRHVGFWGADPQDAPALREANLGITDEHAAEIARECAGLLLPSRDPTALLPAIDEGRRAFANMLKYIQITASSNLGNALSILIAALLLPFLPMRGLQLLVQNLLYDLAQFFLPWDRVDASFRQRPQAWSVRSIWRFMLVFAPLSSVFDLLTFAILWHGFGARTSEQVALFQTGWFTVGLLTQVLIVHFLRTADRPLHKHLASPIVLAASALAMGIGLALPYTPLADALGFVSLPGLFYAWVAIVLFGYAWTALLVKRWYVRRFGSLF